MAKGFPPQPVEIIALWYRAQGLTLVLAGLNLVIQSAGSLYSGCADVEPCPR